MGDPEKQQPKSQEPKPGTASPVRDHPLVFISHDSRDADLAEAFSKLLKDVSGGVLKSFRSSDRKGPEGIEYGVQWYPEIMEKLDAASDVACLLTKRSINRPWILYEAGVARGKLNTQVQGLFLGVPITQVGPFAQFQNCDDKVESITKLVLQLMQRVPDADPDQEAVGLLVTRFKQKADEIVARIDGDKPDEVGARDDQASAVELFEEVKVMFQELPARLDMMREPSTRRRLRRFHPEMTDMMLGGPIGEFGDLGLLLLVSQCRDDLPWLYELGMEVYRALRSGCVADVHEGIRRIHIAIEFMMHGPWGREVFDSKEAHMWVREFPMVLDEHLLRMGYMDERRGE